jgi:Bacterial Ig-like domain
MNLVHASLLVSALAGVSGCPTRNKYDQLPIVRITSPAPDTYTSGTVTITATIDPALDLPIVLRLDNDGIIKTLASPSESYVWNTIGVPEGAHTLVAEVAFSSGPATSAPVIVNVDRTRPTVTLSPTPGSTKVILRSPIKASFSEPVVLSRPGSETFSLSTAGTTVPTTVTFDAQNQTATIAIVDLSSFSLPAAFAATIASTITDRAGNLLVPPIGTWSWSVPDWITLPPLESGYRPVLAIDSDLLPVLAWTLLTNVFDYQLQVAKYDGFGWTQLGPPSSNINSAGRGMDVSLDAENRPLAVWRETSVDFQLAAWTGTSWDTSLPLLSAFGSDSDAAAPRVRLDRVGRPIVIWHEQAPAGRREVFLARWNGEKWDRGFDPLGAPSVAQFDMIVGENPIVSWIFPEDTGHVSIWSGTSWTPAPDVPGMTEPFMAFDSGHGPMVVTSQPGTLLVQRLINGSSWQLLPAASVPPQASYPRIAAGPDGLPVIAYYDAQTRAVGMARWTGQRWDTRAVGFGSNAVDETPQLIVDRQGTAWIGWRGSQFNIWMSNY